MSPFIASIRSNLTSLVRFSGRDTRTHFWPYALVVVVLDWIAMTVAMIPMMSGFQRYAMEHPEKTTVVSGPGHYSISIEGNPPELSPLFENMFLVMAIIVAISVMLLAAAIARRLHDTGKSGLWGVLPLPFLAFGLILMPRLFTGARRGEAPDMSLFFGIFLNNLVYLVMLVALIVLLAREGTKGPNRYGPESVV